MATTIFHLETKEDAAEGLRRILRAQLRNAAHCIRDDGRLTDAEIHNARKSIKRARASVRMLRPALPPQAFEETNIALRDVARPLTHVRDARVLLDALEHLREEKAIDARQLAPLIRDLRAQRTRARRSLARNIDTLPNIRKELRRLSNAAGRWPLDSTGWALLGTALRKIHRRARRAYGTAIEHRDRDECLHEWRKQTKHLWYALQILMPAQPGRIGELADRAHQLTDQLGDDHDLAILRQRMEASALDEHTSKALGALIDRRRKRLQQRALAHGEALFSRKSQRFVGMVESERANSTQ